MKKTGKINNEEKVTDVKGTIIGFVTPDEEEKTQEQEIQDFQLRKQKRKELEKLEDEERKKKIEEYEDEIYRLDKVKEELIKSLKERIKKIEERFKLIETPDKKQKLVQKHKINEKVRGRDDLEKKQEETKEEKERE